MATKGPCGVQYGHQMSHVTGFGAGKFARARILSLHHQQGGFVAGINQLYMLTKFFSTKVISLHRASDTEPKNHQNLWGKPLLKKLDDETQKKVRVQT